jgi:hypothetical protein
VSELALLVPPRFSAEMLYVYADDGRTAKLKVDVPLIAAAGLKLESVTLSDAELDSYVEHVAYVDDGEAQALAIAQHRAVPILTDDRAGIRRAQNLGIDVVTTLDLLHEWSNDKPEDLVVRACRSLCARGRYASPADHPLADWYAAQLTVRYG